MGAFLNILSSLLSGIGQVGGAIGSGIGKVGSTIGGGIEGLAKNISTGGAPMGGFWEGSGGNAGSNGLPQGGLKGVFANPLLAQLLAAGGADLMGNTPGKNIGGAIQQNISSRNMAKVFSTILAGGHPPDGITMTKKGGAEGGETHFKVDHGLFDPSVGDVPQAKTSPIQPTDWLQAGMGLSNPFPTSQPATTAPAPAGAEAQVPTVASTATSDPMIQMLTQLLSGNGSNLGAGFANLRPADLAGVSPEMLSQALQLKMQQEQLGKKNVMDVMDLMMRGKEIGIRAPYMKALTDEAIDRVASNQPIINIGGIPYNTAEYLKWQQIQKENLSTNQKDYSTYAAQEAAAGRQPKSFEEFLNNNFTSDIKNYRLYAEQETKAGRTPKDFDPWLTEHERSRTITTPEMAGEKAAAIKRATGAEEAWTQLHNPTQLNSLVKKAVDDPVTANAIFAARDNPAEMTRIKGRTVAGVIDNIIRTGGGRFAKDTVLSKDGKTLTYTIKWPNHPEPEVFTYAIE